MIITERQAQAKIAELLEDIQLAHRRARSLSREWGISFTLELENSNGYHTHQHFDAHEWESSDWQSSNC